MMIYVDMCCDRIPVRATMSNVSNTRSISTGENVGIKDLSKLTKRIEQMELSVESVLSKVLNQKNKTENSTIKLISFRSRQLHQVLN